MSVGCARGDRTSSPVFRVPSGAMPHALSMGCVSEISADGRKPGYALYELVPVRLMFKLKVIVASKVGVELLAGYELEQVRVEAHLVAGDGVEEGRDTLVEEGEDHRQVHDEGAAERLDVVVLQDREHLARY